MSLGIEASTGGLIVPAGRAPPRRIWISKHRHRPGSYGLPAARGLLSGDSGQG